MGLARMGIEEKDNGPTLSNVKILNMLVFDNLNRFSLTATHAFVRHAILPAGKTPDLFGVGEKRMNSVGEP
jgi:hypothetical protein